MGDKKKPKQIDFIVSTGNPNDKSQAANKKRVRSVAALKSWPERRKKMFEQLETSGSGQGAFLVEPEPKRKATSTPKQSQPEPIAAGPLTARSQSPAVAPGPALLPATPPPTEPTYIGLGAGSSIALYHAALAKVPATKAGVSQVHAVHPDTPCQCPQCRMKRRVANTSLGSVTSTQYIIPKRTKRMADGTEKSMPRTGDLARITPPSSPESSPSKGRMDPFHCYPVAYQPWFGHILHHSKYMTIMLEYIQFSTSLQGGSSPTGH